MISIEQVITIHEILIDKFGGAKGLRDLALLESALSRPYQTFGGIELHENQFQKAAAIIQSLLINHSYNRELNLNKMINIEETNLEYTLKNSQKDDWNFYIRSHQEDFTELIKLSISNKQPYSWRASWLLSSSMKDNDERLISYTKKDD